MTSVHQRSITHAYRCYIGRRFFLLLGMIFLLPFVFFYSISVGPVKISILEVLRILLGFEAPESHIRIIYHSRLPQALAAILAGAGLAVSGTTMQAVLRNPLCSPFTLGISSAAAFGAALTVFLHGENVVLAGNTAISASLPVGSVTAGAFLSSLFATVMILLLAGRSLMKPETIILIGVALGAFYSAGIMMLQYFADEQQLAAMVYWTFGDTQRATWSSIGVVSVLVFIAIVFFISQSWNYNALGLGEENAIALGVPVRRLRLGTMLFSSLLTSVLVASLGIIGFVGLVVPHLVRLLLGSDNRFVLPGSLVLGSLLLLVSDTLARTLIPGRLVPVSIFTAFLGAPIFLLLLLKRKEL